MKRKDIHPLFRMYDSYTWDLKDATKEQKVSVYSASGKTKLEKGLKLFEFIYKPILDENDYSELFKLYDGSEVLTKMYETMCFMYFSRYEKCVKWYIENMKVSAAFNIKEQLKKYMLHIEDEFSCPIIRDLEVDLLDNINFYKNIRNIILYSESKSITSINALLYGKENPPVKATPTSLGKILLNSVINIVYKRFGEFLQSQIGKKENSDSGIETSINMAKSNWLRGKLQGYGFFTLIKVKSLSSKATEELIDLFSSNEVPYQIAMLDFLEFIGHLKKVYYHTQTKLLQGLAEILGSTERTVKGNINVLNSQSGENRERYTAYYHKESVEKDYQKLK